MPSVQSAYNENMPAAVAGARGDMRPAVFLSRTVETVGGIGFGKAVKQGTRDKGCVSDLTGMTIDTFLGITSLDRGTRPETPDVFAQYESARIQRKGSIWVVTGASVVAGDDVTITLASGLFASASVGAGVIAITGARWETSVTGAGLAMMWLG